MKELSIEEKAKRYDEAIERAKEWFKPEEPDSYTCIVESIFPELKESEDDRIRNLIYLSIEKGIGIPGDDRKKALAWLEKQGNIDSQVKLPTFTFDDVLVLQCCMETVKKVQVDKDLYDKLLSLHDKVHDAYTITKNKLL